MEIVKGYLRYKMITSKNASYDAQVKGNWKLSRHIILNHTNISLLLQEAIQKYWKLTDYWTKSCSLFAFLCLLWLVLPVAFLNSRILNVTSDHSCHIYFRFLVENGFLQVKPARCHCLHKKTVFTITSIYIISCLQLLQNIYTNLSLL